MSLSRGRHLERSLTQLVLAGGAPAIALTVVLLWRSGWPAEVRWTLGVIAVGAWLIAASAARQSALGALQVVANLLGALREGDYSIRGLGAGSSSAMAEVMREINDLGSTLQRQRTEAVESAALLTHVMEEIGVAVFAFDPAGHLLLVNRAGERLAGRGEADLIGQPARALGLDEYLDGEPRRLVDRAFAGRPGRYEVRRASFYRDGRPHQLLVVADLSQALREEEQAAWQRIVRVLSHEINNSLTPIKSIAHSLRRIVLRAETSPAAAGTGAAPGTSELAQGLALIEERSGALSRFLRAYAQLARLPKPQPRQVDVAALIRRVAEMEKRLPVAVAPGPGVTITADSDQLEQLLINVIRNAADASVETGGGVRLSWVTGGGWLEIRIDDDGKGLPDTANLFVPFFTTKPNGSGIGLALSRQIAEAHGGTVSLENHAGAAGCRATLRLPLGESSGLVA